MRHALVFVLVFAGACSSSSTGGANAPVAPEPAPVAPEPAPVVETPRAALAYLAPDADIVFGLDVAGLMAAPILAPYRDELLAETPAELRELRERCGLDPLADLRWVIFGFNSKSERGVMVIRGDFTQQKIETCLTDSGAGASVSGEGEVRVYTFGDDTMYARWLGPGAVVATTNDAGGAETLDRALSSGGLSGSLAGRVDQIDNGSHVWLVSGQEAFAQSPLQGATGVRIFARTTDLISAAVVMDFTDANTADSTKTQMDMALGQVGAMAGPELVPIAEAIQLSVVGTSLEARLELTAEQLKTLAGVLRKTM